MSFPRDWSKPLLGSLAGFCISHVADGIWVFFVAFYSLSLLCGSASFGLREDSAFIFYSGREGLVNPISFRDFLKLLFKCLPSGLRGVSVEWNVSISEESVIQQNYIVIILLLYIFKAIAQQSHFLWNFLHLSLEEKTELIISNVAYTHCFEFLYYYWHLWDWYLKNW